LAASARVGAQFSRYPDLNQDSSNPYADVSVSYRIASGTSVEVGVRHMRNATDVASVDGEGHPTMDAETTAGYIHFEHKFTRQFSGSLMGQAQRSEFFDGVNDGQHEYLFLVGANLAYTFNRHWSAEVGYNYDQLVSRVEDGNGNRVPRSYYRNRYYVGVTARY
jgi:long-subunit fatty acid transport protein